MLQSYACNVQWYTNYKNESKHSEMGPVKQNTILRTVRSVHMCAHCTVHNSCTQYCTDLIIFPLTHQTNHHCSDDVYLSEGGCSLWWMQQLSCHGFVTLWPRETSVEAAAVWLFTRQSHWTGRLRLTVSTAVSRLRWLTQRITFCQEQEPKSESIVSASLLQP